MAAAQRARTVAAMDTPTTLQLPMQLQPTVRSRWRARWTRWRAAWSRGGLTSEERWLADAHDAHDLERRQRALDRGGWPPGDRGGW